MKGVISNEMLVIKIIHEIQLSNALVELLGKQAALQKLEEELKAAIDLLEAAIKSQIDEKEK